MKKVVCALIIWKNRLLVTRRGPASGHAGMWEFPGGKIREAETAEQALHREIGEELCVSVEVVEPLRPVVHRYPGKELSLQPYICRWIEGQELVLTEHSSYVWAEVPGEIPDALLPADVALLSDPYNRERLRWYGVMQY